MLGSQTISPLPNPKDDEVVLAHTTTARRVYMGAVVVQIYLLLCVM